MWHNPRRGFLARHSSLNELMEDVRLKVGIVCNASVSFCLNGTFREAGGEEVSGIHCVEATSIGLCWQGRVYASLRFVPMSADATFTVRDVTIGIDFHWQRKQDQTFGGTLCLVNNGGRVQVINELSVEDYLLSVISSEMSATSSLQLLKAHAVISRSWVLGKILATNKQPVPTQQQSSDTAITSSNAALRHIIRWYDTESHSLFHVCADDHCQRYQGISNVNPSVQRAIDETRGEVLMYQGEVCDARFSKCCGGVLEEFQNCWQDTPFDYLSAKTDYIDDPRASSVKDAFCNTDNQEVLRQVLNDYDQETQQFYRWTVEYTTEEISQLVQRKSGIDFGTITGLVPVHRGPSHRITQLHIIGTKTSAVVGKELEIRKWLSPTHLYSSAFDVEQTPHGFRLHGRGWGHGVGLCQIGAAVMGSLGFDYKEILMHYYPNVEVKRK